MFLYAIEYTLIKNTQTILYSFNIKIELAKKKCYIFFFYTFGCLNKI